ncbi:lytic murein transglycosylase [Vannielia litorea]|uniref:lytic murein transglycosylase n=1 Tax=Vannielia litorea TaxID=1217970 RepID=UPI001C95B0DB|nr:lytic murein transglycosylase [Vannielia litorea]MBY6049048.1 lytic murein transglycosylase [Vannielia litorea]MBY6076462.1 lytic murein transglycosylase [Vannielia litorea]
MKRVFAGAVLALVGGAALAGPVVVETAVRPLARPAGGGLPVAEVSGEGFGAWVEGFKARAAAKGIAPELLERAFDGVEYDPKIITRDRNQNEFTKTIWDYLDTAASDLRVTNGQAALKRERAALEAIEAEYGVPKEIVTAIWGLESAYGTYKGDTDIVEALATLAHDSRRGAFFEQQLMAAFEILQAGDVAPRNMKGSWAGAMGHTQFMPTSYLGHAVDFTGDGKRDIWGDDPQDALASAAAYLADAGWVEGMPWGLEVVLPEGFDYEIAGEHEVRTAAEWNAMGVRDVEGRPVPDHGPASIRLPGGAKGAAFMTFGNFMVLERYNTADAYVIAVGHLGDLIAGGKRIQSGWPREDRALTLAEREELQTRLEAAGFDPGGVDGKIGPLTLAAVRAFQKSIGVVPDGYASLAVLQKLR